MHLVSFAQNQEDIMLWRALRHVGEGFYIDVGAADPTSFSVTRIFYDRGWHGINLEPNLGYFLRLRKARPRDTTLSIAAGGVAGQFTFHDVRDSGLSTFDPAIAAEHRTNGWEVTERSVETLPLADICRRYRPEGPIHFLKIDVEGAEADVLAGADFNTFRPWIVLVEATLPGSQTESYERWESLLTSQDYSFVWFDGLNRFYLADEMKPELEQHFRVPPNVFDGFEPASSLLERAEQAEQSLHQAHAVTARDAREAAQTAREAAQGIRQITAAMQQTAAAIVQQTNLTAEVQRRSQAAEMRVSEMLASTSWRLTAPLRMTRRLLPYWRPARIGFRDRPPGEPLGKEFARRVFYRAMRRLLRTPGVRRSVRLVYALAPAPVEWLAQRYRAYGQRRPIILPRPSPIIVKELDDLLAPTRMAPLDLSDEEARLYRQFITSGLVSNTNVSRA
jgi:FkbM family methyltransferase